MFKMTLADLTKKAGLPENPLPEFTDEEKKLNKGTLCTNLGHNIIMGL